MSCVNAINREDLKTARQYVADDMSFVGVLGSRQGADSYFTDMERMRLKYDVNKVFVDGNDVCLFYDLNMSGTTIFLVCVVSGSGRVNTLAQSSLRSPPRACG
jgi:hypothetical protein